MNEENKTADTILQKEVEVKAGGKTYTIARPTLATLIEVSRYTSRLPKATEINTEDWLPYILSCAKDFGTLLSDIAAVLILGAGNISIVKKKVLKSKFLWFKRFEETEASNVEELSRELRNNASCSEINEIVNAGLSYQGIGFFLSSIISLSAANVMERTKNETEAIASGD